MFSGIGFAPALTHLVRAKLDLTRNAGVISGNLSDRFLPITATFLVRPARCNRYATTRQCWVPDERVNKRGDFDVEKLVGAKGPGVVRVQQCSQASTCGRTLSYQSPFESSAEEFKSVSVESFVKKSSNSSRVREPRWIEERKFLHRSKRFE